MRKRFKTVVVTMLFGVGLFAQTATVTLSAQKQYIRGFGGINCPEWAGDLTATQRTTAFGNAAGQIGMTVCRVFVNNDKTQWSRAVATAKYAQSLGATIFATPWNPPVDMCETVTRNNRSEKRLKPSSYDAYAQHLIDFNNYMKSQGVNLYAMSFANEPDWGFDWTWYSADEVYNFTKTECAKLRVNGVKVISAESFSYSKKYYDQILNDATALANIDIIGCHFYGSGATTAASWFNYPLADSKAPKMERWMTEHYTESDNDADLWPLANDVSMDIYDAMVEGQMSVYTWWYIRRKYSPMKEDGSISKRGYCMMNYCKFVRPGYYRVDATKNPVTGVYLSAYKKGDDVAIVVTNRSTSAQTITINVPGTKVAKWDKYVTSGSKSLAQETSINSTTGSFTVTLDASSTTTFNGIAPITANPTVTITAPANNTAYAAPASISLSATATATGSNTISKVEFYNGTSKLGEDASAPYTYTWTNVAAGKYIITAVATDNAGNKGTSVNDTIIVNPAQAPYKGTAWPIPGTVEFENYDVGGNGFAYLDNAKGNTGGASFRTDEDVDIEACTDASAGYNVGYATAGEWMEYTVNVAKAGKYDLTLRVACNGDGRTVSVSAKDVVVAKDVAIPNTAGWQTWKDMTVSGITLEAGVQVIRVTMGATDYVNLNYMSFASATVVAPASIKLKAGWNIVGCPIVGSTDIATALLSVWSNVEVVKNLDAFYLVSNPAALNSLNKLNWGQGYLVKVKADCSLSW